MGMEEKMLNNIVGKIKVIVSDTILTIKNYNMKNINFRLKIIFMWSTYNPKKASRYKK